MSYDKVTYGILNADASSKTEIGVDSSGYIKVYPAGDVPQDVERPYATYLLVSEPENQDKDGDGWIEQNVQLDHYGNTTIEAEAMHTASYAALNRYSGTINGISVNSIRARGGGSGWSEDKESRRRSKEYNIKINR